MSLFSCSSPETLHKDLESDLESLCSSLLSDQLLSNNTTFCFDIYSENKRTYDCSDTGLANKYFVKKTVFDALSKVEDYKFLKKVYKNSNGIFQIYDILVIHYTEENRLHYMIAGEWKVKTKEYLVDFLETVLEDLIDNVYNFMLKTKKNAQVSTPSVNKPINVWKNPLNLKVKIEGEQDKLEDNSDDINLPNPIVCSFLVYNNALFPPPHLDWPTYGIDEHIFNVLNEIATQSSYFHMKKFFTQILDRIYAMDRIFMLDKLMLEEHTYGLLIKIAVNPFYIGDYNNEEYSKKHIRVTQEIVQNTFWDYLNCPPDIPDISDGENELFDEPIPENDLNNFVEEKTENYLIEE